LQGPLGFYKGMAAPVVGVTPIFALSFFGFNVGKALQQDKPDDPLTLVTLFILYSDLLSLTAIVVHDNNNNNYNTQFHYAIRQ